MNPRDFHDIARQLYLDGRPAALRSAISRAYYAAFNAGAEILRRAGFQISDGPGGHGEVRDCLSNSGDPEVEKAGYKLSNLHTQRLHADYKMDRSEIENKKREVFMMTMEQMANLFKEIYSELTNGEANLGLENPDDINSGLMVSAQPPGKKLLYIDAMSGGEKTLTALAFLFTIQRYRPSPFYVLDEIDAALDKPNTMKVVELIMKQSKDVQFVIISHNNEMVKAAEIVYGVSMEGGESKVIGIKLPKEN